MAQTLNITQHRATKTPRRFLFLQGPHGPFFYRLSKKLEQAGHQVYRVNLNGGDVADWPEHAIDYADDISQWDDYVANLFEHYDITDLVLYGAFRPHHEPALRQARARSITLHLFEEGYLRPWRFTLDHMLPHERHEQLRQQLEVVQGEAEDPVLHGPTSSNMWLQVRWMLRHYILYGRYRHRFLNYATHRNRSPLAELGDWTRKVLAYSWQKTRCMRILSRLDGRVPFYLVGLQINCDSQVTRYSPYRMADLLDMVIPSFAAHGPKDALLVIKNHPYDSGQGKLGAHAKKLARHYGIEDRVIFLLYGKAGPLLHHAKGLITVNSTLGIQAMFHHCPVKIFGQAVYDIPGLIDPQSLDSFWQHPVQPDSSRFLQFKTLLMRANQCVGDFYSEAGIRVALNSSTARMFPRQKPQSKRPRKVVPTADIS